MGLTHVKNFWRRISKNKFLEHFAAVMFRVTHLSPQLAIGKSTSPTLAKLDIRFRMKFTLAPQTKRVFGPLAHDLASLNNKRTKTHLRKN